MKTCFALLAPVLIILSACAPPEALTQTAVAQTQAVAAETQAPAAETQARVAETEAFRSNLATALSGTQTAAAPTATRTSPPPTATATVPPSPTPSGEYGFFDVSIKQVSPAEVAVSFGYQVKEGANLDKVLIGAVPANCGGSRPALVFSPYDPKGTYSGMVSGENAVHVWLDKPGKCPATSIKLYLFVPNSYSTLYQEVIQMPFTLEKDQ